VSKVARLGEHRCRQPRSGQKQIFVIFDGIFNVGVSRIDLDGNVSGGRRLRQQRQPCATIEKEREREREILKTFNEKRNKSLSFNKSSFSNIRGHPLWSSDYFLIK